MCWADGVSFDFTPAVVALLALTALVAIVVVIPLGRRFLGPLFVLELSRAARNGRMNLLRIGYAVALLIALFTTFPSESELDQSVLSAYAERFANLFLFIQSVAALVITPILFGSAITSEKENRTLDFLLVTRLSAAEIVLGKYAGWFFNLMEVLLTGLPILALTIFWGGVDLVKVLMIFAADALAILSLGAIGIYWSVVCRRNIAAVLLTAMSAALILFGCGGRWLSPIVLLRTMDWPNRLLILRPAIPPPLPALGESAIAHGAIAIVCLGLSMVLLRRTARPAAPAPEFAGRLAIPTPEPSRDYVRTTITANPIRGDALLWRERHRGFLNDPYADLFWLYPAGFLFLMTLASGALSGTHVANLINAIFQIAAGIALAGLCLILLLRLADCISRERERRTLESLLSLPISRERILYVKWLGAALRSSRWAMALAVALVLGAVSGVFGWLEAALLLLLGFSWAALISAISLGVSVFARTTVRAYIYAIVAVVGLAAAVTLNAQFSRPQFGHKASFLGLLSDALSPFHARQLISQIKLGKDAFVEPILPLLSAALIYFALAAAIAAGALWRFRREERYT